MRRVGRAHICTGCAQLKPVCPGSEQNASPICNSASLPALPRSLLLHESGNVPHLLVGLGDGTLVAFAFVKNGFQEKRVFSLAVGLTQFEMGEKRVVFGSGSRATVFFVREGILQHSTILIKVNVTSRKTTPFKAGLVNRAFLRARGLTHRTGCSLCFDIVQMRCRNGARSR
jgi:hypothetical protein